MIFITRVAICDFSVQSGCGAARGVKSQTATIRPPQYFDRLLSNPASEGSFIAGHGYVVDSLTS